MKTKLIILLVCLCAGSGCENNVAPKKPFSVHSRNGSGWGLNIYTIDCDSFQMITPMECRAYYNGTEMTLKAELITVSSNR